jgi:hypothetical protein
MHRSKNGGYEEIDAGSREMLKKVRGENNTQDPGHKVLAK